MVFTAPPISQRLLGVVTPTGFDVVLVCRVPTKEVNVADGQLLICTGNRKLGG
jgi:hypothetical protein